MKRREKPIKRKNPSGKTVWVARPTDRDGKRHYRGTFKLAREAQDAIDAAYLEWEQGGPVKRDTVGAYAQDWTERYPRSERTDRTNNHRIGRLLDVKVEGRVLRDWPLAEIRRTHVNELVGHMLRNENRAVTGARDILRAFSAMAEDAINDEIIGSNPFKGVKIRANDRRTSKRSREPRIWTWEQMHAFAGHAGQYEPMLRMLADCGLRVGELLALRRELQDLKAGVFIVNGSAWNGQVVESSETKRHDRQGPIPPTCLALLRGMPTRLDSPWLFSTPGSRRVGKVGRDLPGGLLWRYDNWRRQVWLPTCEAAGMNPTPQEFRHSWNSLLAAAGVDAADRAEIAGHSEAVNAGVYTHALGRSFDHVRSVIG